GGSYFLFSRQRPRDAWFLQDRLLERLLADLQIDLVIDAGANEGQFGERLRRFYGGELFSFEPVAEAYEKLAAKSANDKRWRAFQFGLGAAESQSTIHIAGLSVFSSLLPTNDYA